MIGVYLSVCLFGKKSQRPLIFQGACIYQIKQKKKVNSAMFFLMPKHQRRVIQFPTRRLQVTTNCFSVALNYAFRNQIYYIIKK